MTQTKISGKFYAIQKDYSPNNRQKSFTVGEETADYSARKPDSGFTPWTWTNDDRLVRYSQNNGIVDYDSEQECSNESDLEKQIEIVTKIRQKLVDRSSGSRKKDYLQSIQDRDQHLDYLRQRLELVRSTQLFESPNSQAADETEPESTAVVDAEELTPDEERDRTHLERKVERAFYEAGKALQQLRDRKLYRSTHGTFEEYCRDRFGYNRRQPYLLIESALVVDNLSEKCDQFDHIFPTKEGQVRSLTQLEPDQQHQVWQQAVEASGGKIPSGRVVKDIVQQIMEKTKVPNPYRVGEVCQIIPKDNPDLRGKGGCWGIVQNVSDFSCTVMAWDGEYTVRIDHLKLLEYTDADAEQMKKISDRLTRLRNHKNLEPAALGILSSLGELKRPYLTPFEEKLLQLTELEYEE